jgi:hypothetical protein
MRGFASAQSETIGEVLAGSGKAMSALSVGKKPRIFQPAVFAANINMAAWRGTQVP